MTRLNIRAWDRNLNLKPYSRYVKWINTWLVPVMLKLNIILWTCYVFFLTLGRSLWRFYLTYYPWVRSLLNPNAITPTFCIYSVGMKIFKCNYTDTLRLQGILALEVYYYLPSTELKSLKPRQEEHCVVHICWVSFLS